jgi:hypothetical protein
MDESGRLAPVLTAMGDLLSNDEAIASGLLVFKDAYLTRDALAARDHSGILQALQKTSQRVNPGRVADGIEQALDVATSNAAHELRVNLQGITGTARGFKTITDGGLAFLLHLC